MQVISGGGGSSESSLSEGLVTLSRAVVSWLGGASHSVAGMTAGQRRASFFGTKLVRSNFDSL